MMTGTNGKATELEVLTNRELLEGIAEGLAELNKRFEEFQEEVMEKFANIGVEESAYGIEKLFDED